LRSRDQSAASQLPVMALNRSRLATRGFRIVTSTQCRPGQDPEHPTGGTARALTGRNAPAALYIHECARYAGSPSSAGAVTLRQMPKRRDSIDVMIDAHVWMRRQEARASMSDPTDLYPFIFETARAMMFVDGENLAIRYGDMASVSTPPNPYGGFWHMPNVAVWAQALSPPRNSLSGTRIVRRYYYTAVQGDEPKQDEVIRWIKDRGFEAPRVFKKEKGRASKQVDISLAIDMLTHAARKHYDIAVLVAGDADYVPLVRAVKAEGARVHVWFVSSGLSDKLRVEADHFVNLDGYFSL
jgi:uncharacterized LabA/DUF88 family protein